jgi:carbon monoxide dehydrogenase subunit G
MDLQGSRYLAATQQQAWDALNDADVLKACIPGCDKVEATGPGDYAVGMLLKLGPVSARFSGRILLSDVEPLQRYTLNFEGQGGVAGFGKGRAQVTLAPEGEGCTLSYVVDAQVGGKVAQIGRWLLRGASRSLTDKFFARFDAALQARL